MLFNNENFSLDLDGIVLSVYEHTVGTSQVFHIIFSDNRTPLSITRALTRIGKTWVSLPQGRQKEAEEIGGLIVEHFKKK